MRRQSGRKATRRQNRRSSDAAADIIRESARERVRVCARATVVWTYGCLIVPYIVITISLVRSMSSMQVLRYFARSNSLDAKLKLPFFLGIRNSSLESKPPTYYDIRIYFVALRNGKGGGIG